ncbi:hypothetical protein CIT292_07318 [Citrobacter youngae ATCC 29220]|uniref:Uncharacterized protein n=1 Tax=Citrobacter youngae ATCC 29220 TaxID=500640 RepID=D4BA28_9ENTR|nr:hypothetical protein CIT292_07318 [Citrobacter youngae ATCC 29220]
MEPYHSRQTYACWFVPSGVSPSVIAHQMEHEVQGFQTILNQNDSWQAL